MTGDLSARVPPGPPASGAGAWHLAALQPGGGGGAGLAALVGAEHAAAGHDGPLLGTRCGGKTTSTWQHSPCPRPGPPSGTRSPGAAGCGSAGGGARAPPCTRTPAGGCTPPPAAARRTPRCTLSRTPPPAPCRTPPAPPPPSPSPTPPPSPPGSPPPPRRSQGCRRKCRYLCRRPKFFMGDLPIIPCMSGKLWYVF